jgi:predicted ArsR family transcriptional regulator
MTDLVHKYCKVGGPARLILLTLADAANSEDDLAWLAVGTIAERTGLVERTIQKHLRQLVESGDLDINPQAGPYRTNYYQLGRNYREGAPDSPNPCLSSSSSAIDSDSREKEEYKDRVHQIHPYRSTTRAQSNGIKPPHPERANKYAQWDTTEDKWPYRT